MEEKMPTVTTLEQTSNYGKFGVEPLERGYGNTLGNALRRVLLSSIPGAAVTAVKVDKVLHEFSKIEGVKEDTNELLLNLKDLAVKIQPGAHYTEEDRVLRLEVKGQGRVTGADVQCPPDMEIVNPESYIATISDPKGSFGMDLYIGQGRGYEVPDKRENRKQIIGIIPVGAQYTPVRRVNFIVEAIRVGYKTDYERLTLEVWTNGTILPAEAVSQAALVLDRYVRLFSDLAANTGDMLPAFAGEDSPSDYANVPDTRIEELDFSQRTFNCLRRANLLSLRDLVQVSENDLINIRGFGRKSLQEVREKLEELNFGLKPPKNGAVRMIPADFDDEEDEE